MLLNIYWSVYIDSGMKKYRIVYILNDTYAEFNEFDFFVQIQFGKRCQIRRMPADYKKERDENSQKFSFIGSSKSKSLNTRETILPI